MKSIINKILIGSAFLSFSLSAQIKSGNKAYKKYDFQKTIAIYKDKIGSSKMKAEDYKNLANAYYQNAQYEKASTNFEQYINKSEQVSPEVKLKYAKSLKVSGKVEKSEQIMQTLPVEFYQNWSDEKDSKSFSDSPSSFTIENYKDINSANSDFSSGIWKDQMIFASARRKSLLKKNVHSWTGEEFLDLYEVNSDSEITALSKKINSKLNESSAVLTEDGLTMYFTRNNVVKEQGKDDHILLAIFRAQRESVKSKWGNIEKLSFNSDKFSCAHPALSKDEKTLYFASDMPGTKGASDIFRVTIGKESFGKPKPVSKINTIGRESFPYISKKGELFFASDGHYGKGGLDIYKYDLTSKEINHLPSPINSVYDDFALVYQKDHSGYFSSNRIGGKGKDDIYSFQETVTKPKVKDLPCSHKIDLLVVDKFSLEPLVNAQVDVKATSYKTDSKGKISLDLACTDKLHFLGSKEGYNSESLDYELTKLSPKEEELILKLTPKIFYKEKDNYWVQIEPIYFDFDKSNIRPDAAKTLDELVVILKKYPKINIESGSHTDSRGSDTYNVSLSERRAKSTKEYLINKGISAKRLSHNGYGEKELTNSCSNGVKCSEKEHQLNRRSTFRITNSEVLK
jgi:outer membrane protein OmpA-like peptidoglycan-associated protein